MGCDIHAVFQAQHNGRWHDVPSKFDEPRHYFLFAWLAGVRNGYGFAGVPTHDPIRPIAPQRGLPHGMTDEHNGKWLGDHSHSWLTSDEILCAPLPKAAMRTGIVERAFAESWDGVSQPKTWSGGISGPGIAVAESPRTITPETTHVRLEWALSADDELGYFLKEIRRLHDQHGLVRMVFGFDS